MSDRVLGIDYGTKRIGLALSDESGSVAFPREVIENNAKMLERIKAVLEDERVGHVVVGESRAHGGVNNQIAEEIASFSSLLGTIYDGPISHEPEFLSSVEADRALYDAGVRKQVEHLDAHAAAVILQRYLDKQDK